MSKKTLTQQLAEMKESRDQLAQQLKERGIKLCNYEVEIDRRISELEDYRCALQKRNLQVTALTNEKDRYKRALEVLPEMLTLTDPRDHIILSVCKDRPEIILNEKVEISIPNVERLGPDERETLINFLYAEKKIQAIKLYRDVTGMGLKESKDAVEAVQASLGLGRRPQ